MNPKLLLIFLAFAATSIFSPKANVALAADGDDQQCGPEVTEYVANQLTFDKKLLFEDDLCVALGYVVSPGFNTEILLSKDCGSSQGHEARWSIGLESSTDYTVISDKPLLVLSCLDSSTATPMTENCTIGYLYAAGIQNDEQRFRLTVYKEQWKRSDNGHHDMVYFSVNSIKWPERCLSK